MSSVAVVAEVMLGCKLTDIAREEVRTAQSTKYDPDTGVPYKKTVTEKAIVLGQGAGAREFDGWGELMEWLAVQKDVPGMTVGDSGGEFADRHQKAVVGVRLAVVTAFKHTPCEVASAPPNVGRVAGWLTEQGMLPSHWKTYLVVYVG